MTEQTTPGWARSIDRATKALSALAGISLLFMVAVITIGVLTRYLFNNPMTGSDEIVQMTGVALPYAIFHGAHVRVDIFDDALGHWGRMAGDILARLQTGFVLVILVARAWSKMLDAFEFGDTTNMLGLPIWPFYGILAAGISLCVLVYAVELLLILATERDK